MTQFGETTNPDGATNTDKAFKFGNDVWDFSDLFSNPIKGFRDFFFGDTYQDRLDDYDLLP